MRKIVPLFFVFILIFSGVAHAADRAVSAAGAADLKKQIEDDLQWRTDMTKIFDQGLMVDGKTEVTPKNGFYEVRLPHLSLSAGAKGKLDIGSILLNVAPDPHPGVWQILQATLPPMTFYDDKDAPVAKISIGSQRFAATWEPGKGIYPKVDSVFEDIKITSTGDNAISGKIATLKSLVDLKDNGDGTWSGPADFDASGLTLDVPGENPVVIGISKISAHNTYDRLDMSNSLRMKDVAQQSIKKNMPKSEQERKEFLAKILTESPLSADNIGGTLSVDKFFLHDTGTPLQPRRDIVLNHLVIDGGTASVQKDKSRISLKTGFDGLHISFIPSPLADIVPQSQNMEITLDNLPSKQISKLFFAVVQKSVTAQAAGQSPEAQAKAKKDANADLSVALSFLPKMLEDAGASLTVQNTYLKSAALETSLQGNIVTSPAAALGGTGKVSISIKGLDELVQTLQGNALKPGADPHAMGYFAGAMAMEMKGQPDKAADGKSIRNYIFELKQDGDILLNGMLINPRTASGTEGTPEGNKGMTPPDVMPHSHPMIPAPSPAPFLTP